jgi:hypothetical protein
LCLRVENGLCRHEMLELKRCQSDQLFWCSEGGKWALSVRSFGAEKVRIKCYVS